MNAPETLTLNVQVPADVLARALAEAATTAEAKRVRWLRTREAAEHCGMGQTLFLQLAKKFNIPRSEEGRAVTYATANLDAMMAANQTAGGSAVRWPVTLENLTPGKTAQGGIDWPVKEAA